MVQTALARAKVNLTLHVTGQRADGYHLLDSLVVFPEIGDFLEAEPADGLSLTLSGKYGADLDAGGDNLVIRAAEALRPRGQGAALRLTKSLPVASGIGGGSADAAATLRVLSEMWNVPIPEGVALSLGADVPVCLGQRAARMGGIGEMVSPVVIPAFWLLLVNTGRPISTKAVFEGLPDKHNPPMSEDLPIWKDAAALAAWLSGMRNDLEDPAREVDPSIGDVLSALRRTEECLLARMSGSGGTCWGMYATQASALKAQAVISRDNPDWWCVAGPVNAR